MITKKNGLLIAKLTSVLLVVSTQTFAKDFIIPPMVNIPSGEFMMGAEGGDPATTPIHPVTVNKFQMSKYAVTVAEFRKYAEDTGFIRESTCNDFIDDQGLRGPTHKGTGRWDNHKASYSEYQPAVCISWQDANDYASWLSKKSGINFRLPNEAEWEYAVKANTTTRYFWGDDLNMTQACSYGNFADQTGEHTNNTQLGLSNVGWIEHADCDDGEAYNAIVGLYRPNPFGLYDMLGNVSEFVNACYDEKGYSIDSKIRQDVENCEFFVHRGGNWHYPADPMTTRDRSKKEGWNVGNGIGFRLVSDEHNINSHPSTKQFELALNNAKAIHLANRTQLLSAPKSTQIVKLADGKYKLTWQPSTDSRVIGYDIYRSKTQYSHFHSGFYQKHYDKLETVSANEHSILVEVPIKGGSYRVVAISENSSSLPSPKAIVFNSPEPISLPGRFDMRHAKQLDNVNMYHWKKTDKYPEEFPIFKTNKDSDKSEVSVTFSVNVKKSGWFQLNYKGSTHHKGEFFKIWQGNRLAGNFDYDPEIDDKKSKRHKLYLNEGIHDIQVTVLREKFDMWGLVWLEFSEIKEPS